MRRKLAGYFLVLSLSFIIFTLLNTHSHAQESNAANVLVPEKVDKFYVSTQLSFDIPTLTQIPTPTNTPTPTPTDTPTPTLTPTPTVIATTVDLETLFDKYASLYSVDKNLLKKIARCESGFNTTSNNNGMYLGMFQFAQSSWVSARSRMGMDTNPDLRTNAEESIKTASYIISSSGSGAWPNCSR